jgi:ABC-type multidrug transport system ATPase subunit
MLPRCRLPYPGATLYSFLLLCLSASRLGKSQHHNGTATAAVYPKRPAAFAGTMYEGSAPPLALSGLETAATRRTCNASFGTFSQTFSYNHTLPNGDVVVLQNTTFRNAAPACPETSSAASPCCPRGSLCEHGVCRVCELGMLCPAGTIAGPGGAHSVVDTLTLLRKDYPDANKYDPPGSGAFMYNVCPVGRYCPSPWDDVFPCPFKRNGREKCRPGTYIRGLREREMARRSSNSNSSDGDVTSADAPPWSSWYLTLWTIPCRADGMFLCHTSTRNLWCPAGYFCPNRMVALTCPVGHWCPQGSLMPFPCRTGWLDSKCHAGQDTKSTGMSFTVISVVLFVGLATSFRASKLAICRAASKKRRRRKKNAKRGCCKATPMEAPNTIARKRTRKSLINAALGVGAGDYCNDANGVGDDDEEEEEEVDTMSEMDAVRATFPEREGVSFSFENLCLTVNAGGHDKLILSNVTGSIKAGTLNAVMGPSGAGKTTFMNVLCDRVGYGERSGKLLINSTADRFANHRDVMGFVPQDDTVHEDLTVRENLHYAACMRLPLEDKECSRCGSLLPSLGALCGLNKSSSAETPFVSRNYYAQHVHVVLRMMQLDHIQDSIVGSVEKRGISGGQRKRVNIGLEIVADPIVLFLDEPTSGLDSTSSGVIMKAW